MQNIDKPTFNDESLSVILGEFASGEQTKQGAFGKLIGWCKDHLAPFKKERGGVARGAVTALRNHVEQMDLAGLTSSYVVPSVTMASALIKGDYSSTLEYVIENLDMEGSGEDGEIRGPLFTPGRLNACWGLITKKQGSPFEVTMEGLKLGGRLFATYRIKELKEFAAGPERTRSDIEELLGILGEDPASKEDPSKAKPGTMGGILKKVREKNEEQPSAAMTSFADAFEKFLAEQRIMLSREVAVHEAAKAQEAVMAAEKRARERLAEVRGEVPASVEETSDRRRKAKGTEANAAAQG